MRLIDADAFRREIDTYPPFDKETQDSNAMANLAKDMLLVALNNMPTIDAVPVIRCKDCKYYKWEIDMCNLEGATVFPMNVVHEDDFCSRAERKEHETD